MCVGCSVLWWVLVYYRLRAFGLVRSLRDKHSWSVKEYWRLWFAACGKLSHIKIPDSVLRMGENALGDCVELKSAILSKNMQAVSDGLFYNCKSLVDIEIPYGFETICDNAFFGCTSLEDIKLPETIQNILCCAFEGCTKLKSIKLPNNADIFDEAFANCTSLEVVHCQAVIESRWTKSLLDVIIETAFEHWCWSQIGWFDSMTKFLLYIIYYV